jgi:pimeloyl-ACP methyl ester carboxylesterase
MNTLFNARKHLAVVIGTLTALITTANAQTKQIAAVQHSKKTVQSAPAFKSGYAPVNGLQLYYEIHGKGTPLVLLHGGFGTTTMFGNNLTTLSKSHQVIAVDLQAHGRTADIDREMTPEFMADDIAALLKHLHIKQADIMGYSLGGMVALQTAIRHPEAVRKLVVVSAPFSREGFYPEIRKAQEQLVPEAAEALKQIPYYQDYASVAPKPADWPKLVTKLGKLIQTEYNWSNDIKNIKTPTLIAFADADLISTAHIMEFYSFFGGGQRAANYDGSLRPNAQLAIIPNTTHYSFYTAPVLATTVLPFLDEPVAAAK